MAVLILWINPVNGNKLLHNPSATFLPISHRKCMRYWTLMQFFRILLVCLKSIWYKTILHDKAYLITSLHLDKSNMENLYCYQQVNLNILHSRSKINWYIYCCKITITLTAIHSVLICFANHHYWFHQYMCLLSMLQWLHKILTKCKQ